MPRSHERTRTRILDAAYALFRRSGYTRVSMDEIAAATAVTKRTLYYHFKSKDELLAAVLETQHRLALAAFRTFGDSLGGSPRHRRHAVPGPRGVVRQAALGRLRFHPAGGRARRSAGTSRPRHRAPAQGDARSASRRAARARRSRAPREIAREIWLLSEGAISLMLVHRDRSYAAAAALAAKKLLRLNSAKRK